MTPLAGISTGLEAGGGLVHQPLQLERVGSPVPAPVLPAE